MSNREEKAKSRQSKKLSWLLRHGAIEAGLAMDEAGWVATVDVLAQLEISRGRLEELVATNTKKRLQLDGARVRACQGHSLAGTPVTQDALEASWTEREGSDSIFHGTSLGALASIAKKGLVPVKRTHVHLASSMTSTVGKRASVHVMLEVDPSALRGRGLFVFEAPNGVVLVRWVPVSCIVELHAMTKKARGQEDELRALLGL